MAIYYESFDTFLANGGLKQTTITAKQLLPAVVAHMQRMDRKFTLQVNGRLPKSMSEMLNEVLELSHLQQPFYTQHCSSRATRYMNVSKNRVKIEFTCQYRMGRPEEAWVVREIDAILQQMILPSMSDVEKVATVHDYIVRNHRYELDTKGSPFTVYTFMHERQGVCMAYALLFEKMMERLQIPCFYVIGHAVGEGERGHAWNMVQLDDAWYHIDATWNDLGSKTKTHEIRYRYFLCSDDFMRQDHEWNLDHYPPCTSEKYALLRNLYDVALIGGELYFPHPKTAHFTKMSLKRLHYETIATKRVQFCTASENGVFYSDYDDEGYLYEWESELGNHTNLVAEQVKSITWKQEAVTVKFYDGESLSYERKPLEVASTEKCILPIDETVALFGFGDSWFASYEGEEQIIAFESDDGMKLTLQKPVKQITVDLLLHKGMQLTFSSNRKDITFEPPAKLFIPFTIIESGQQLSFASGKPIHFKEKEQGYEVFVERNERIIIAN